MALSENRCPTFPDHAAGTKKAPDLSGTELRVELMRSFDYARTPPEAPEGLVVLVARLVVEVIMARTYAENLS